MSKKMIYGSYTGDEDGIFDHEYESDLWDEFEEDMKRLFDKGTYIMHGYFMAWNGKQEGGKIIRSSLEFLDVLRMNDSRLEVYDEKGVFKIDQWHHDAPVYPNHYELKRLTKLGMEVALNDEYDSRRELIEALRDNPRYSKNMNYFRRSKKVKQ